MSSDDTQQQAVGLLQQLGLKEYEAKCFVALSRLPKGTAKQISDIADTPRTRVYDAIRVLEAKGLVEIQHSSPQQFRAVSLDEATETLRQQYESRVDELSAMLEDIEPVELEEETTAHEVWGLSSAGSIAARTSKLIGEAAGEVVLVVGSDGVVTDALIESLNEATERGISVLVGTVSEDIREQLQSRVTDINVFVSELKWLHESENSESDDNVTIERILLVDRDTILLSSLDPSTAEEHAVFGRGFDNGLVVLTRRLMASGLLSSQDPGWN
ncbi:transcriptional regulator [Haloprofundus marisrubri]|uniref:Transcriptional regulator n=1 Tax=Haloprofundus marisrubri TaxID=1514971 RepID=A0A0W1RBZ4_9EURY|nr:helix-turn-helix domain-containing protein [Haloprofundus marisrubri]KTG10645.1 transcriptional regulator [Haloprofundus marisrubri]